ncbi:ribonuclease H2, subunit C [Dendryphion nanum]|uniref:Ribonuclease H2, subunit C n=1 Tax=Dendryphion nanum TaxID=256645 RepID=A0A9P9E197_9PLEO|nr:ribonuclease H2, subunit C [Dendryphion nanum]
MLSIQPSKTQQKCTPNLLPARINHNGPVNNASQYWKPETDPQGKDHAYFRGRHLHGTAVPLPANYAGAVLNVTEKDLPETPGDKSGVDEDPEGEDDDMKVEVKIAEQIGTFDEMMVWKHGSVVDEKADIYVRSVEEWIGFAEAMHCEDDTGEAEGKKS